MTTTAPPVPFLPESVHGKPVAAIAGVRYGPLDSAEEAVSPLRTLAEPILDHFGPVPYVAMQQAIDPLWTAGAYNYFTSAMMLDGLSDAAIDDLLGQLVVEADPTLRAARSPRRRGDGRVPSSQTAFRSAPRRSFSTSSPARSTAPGSTVT